MNPYVNSLNGYGGGFIAYWPSQGVEEDVLPKGGGSSRLFLAYDRIGLMRRIKEELEEKRKAEIQEVKISGGSIVMETMPREEIREITDTIVEEFTEEYDEQLEIMLRQFVEDYISQLLEEEAIILMMYLM